jgi:sterol 3beta-glucosyltransferase
VLNIGPVPYDWLFPQVAAVVHACGAGTAGAGLRAGVPTVPVPSPGGDQPFWARHLHELGAATAPLPRPKLTAEQLARGIERAVTEPGYRDAAARLAAVIAQEDGAGTVVERIERLLD